MRGRPDEIDEALATLRSQVTELLLADGWTRRLVDEHSVATFTRSTPNGILAVIEINRTSFTWPADWPVKLEASLGVGYESALDLMPLLTLNPRAILIVDPEHGRAHGFTIDLAGVDGVSQAAQGIVHFARDNASSVIQNFPDAAAIDEQLRCDIATAQTRSDEEGHGDDGNPGAADFGTRLRLVVLAAMGRHEDVRALLATYPAQQSPEGIKPVDRRFIRQLTRWLDAGGPVAPPIEETLAQLPRRAGPPRPSWSDARSKARAKKAAFDATRAKSKGQSLDQLKHLIAAEYGARGIDIAPSAVDFNAELLQSEQQLFGRARNAIKAIRILTSSGRDMIEMIKRASAEDPAWLRPPDRATYPTIEDRIRHVSVELDAAAHDWLELVRAEAPRRMGPWVLVDVWLSRETAAGPTRAYIGERLVGTLRSSDSGEFDRVLRAAALFDEDPFVVGRLTKANVVQSAALEIPLPQLDPADPAT